MDYTYKYEKCIDQGFNWFVMTQSSECRPSAWLFSGEIANNATADVTVDEYHRYKVTNYDILMLLFQLTFLCFFYLDIYNDVFSI